MGRIKVQFEAEHIRKFNYKVKATDINYGGHLDNARILGIAHAARIFWLGEFGWSEMDVDGVSTIMADAAIQYLSEGFEHDELEVETGLGEIGSSGFELFYRINNLTTAKVLAIVKTGSVFYSYKEKKVQRTPEGFLKLKSG